MSLMVGANCCANCCASRRSCAVNVDSRRNKSDSLLKLVALLANKEWKRFNMSPMEAMLVNDGMVVVVVVVGINGVGLVVTGVVVGTAVLLGIAGCCCVVGTPMEVKTLETS